MTATACSTYCRAFVLSEGEFRASRMVQIARSHRENFSTERVEWSRLAWSMALERVENEYEPQQGRYGN